MGAVTARPRARRLPAPVRQDQILDAALTVFARTSFREAATAAVAAELGVSEPTIFRHFPTKRALYLATLDRSAETILSHWQEIVARSPSPLQGLLEMGRWYFTELQKDSRHLRLRFRSCGEVADPQIGDRVRAQFRALRDLVQRLFEDARAAGEIAADTDTQAHAWLFMAIGTLLDVTQIAGLRADLPLEAIPSLLLRISPEPGSGHPLGADCGPRDS